MEELRKIYRILEREYPEAYLETLVVLDGTTGQNALAQAKQFAEVANVNGIILTKLDGTAKGGIAVAIQSELDIPVNISVLVKQSTICRNLMPMLLLMHCLTLTKKTYTQKNKQEDTVCLH